MVKHKAKSNSETATLKKTKPKLDDIDPFLEFKEWANAVDEKAYKKL